MPRHKDLVRPGLTVDAFAAFHRRGSEAFALTEEVVVNDDKSIAHSGGFVQSLRATHEVSEQAEAGATLDDEVFVPASHDEGIIAALRTDL